MRGGGTPKDGELKLGTVSHKGEQFRACDNARFRVAATIHSD
jgi:hypothetical protein